MWARNGHSSGEHATFAHTELGSLARVTATAPVDLIVDAELFNKTGRPIIIENCHQGQNFPDGGDPNQMGDGCEPPPPMVGLRLFKGCPYNFFRTSGDIINVWDRVIENLMSVTKFLTKKGVGAGPVGRDLEPPIYFPPPPPGKHAPTMPAARPGCW